MRNRQLLAMVICLTFFVFGFGEVVEADGPWTEYDFNGRTVTYTSRVGGEVEMILNPDEEQAAHLKWVEEVFNVKLDAQHYAGSADDLEADTITGVLAGDPPGDILSNHTRCMQVGAVEGVVYRLDDILDDDYFESIPEYFAENQIFYQSGHDGGTYGIHSLHTPTGAGLWWNRDLFEREGLPDLHELWQNDEWDLDTFWAVAEQAQRDTTGDGEIDQFGYTDGNGIVMRVAGSRGTSLDEETGRWKVDIAEPWYIEAGQWAQDFYEAGLLNYDLRLDGQELVKDGVMAMTLGTFWAGNTYLESEDHISLVPFPLGKNPAQEKPVFPHWNARPFFFPVTEEQPEAIVELTNAIFQLTDSYRDVDGWWEELEEDLALGMADQKSLEIAELLLRNAETALYYMVVETSPSCPVRAAITEGMDIASTYTSDAVRAQAELDEMLGY